MATARNTVAEPLDLWALRTITAHPVVAPLAEQRRGLQAKRIATAQDLQAARVRLATLSASPDTTPKEARQNNLSIYTLGQRV
jgi:hypothetical protein